MLNRKLRITIIIGLTILLRFILAPIVASLFLDVLPTNSNVPIDEYVSKIVPVASDYTYVTQDDYLVALTYNKDLGITQNFFAIKGTSSGFVDTSFSIGSGVYAKKFSETKILDGVDFSIFLVMHKSKYLITVSTFETGVVLFDNNHKMLASIQQGNDLEFIDVVSNLTEEYKIYTIVEDKEILVLDYNELNQIFK